MQTMLLPFLADFGREPSYRACGSPTWGACDGDFECDGDVDADDVSKFLEDFGREPSFKPCPACIRGRGVHIRDCCAIHRKFLKPLR